MVNSNVAVSGSGVSEGSAINFDGSTTGVNAVPSSGQFGPTSIIIPAGTVGTHSITLAGGSNTISYTVTPSITLSSNAGLPGSSTTVTGTGFAANKIISVSVGDTNIASTSSAVTSDDNGGFTYTTNIPSSLSTGAHTLTAKDTNANSATSTFNVNGATFTISPASGSIGTITTLTGSGFSAHTTLTTTYNSGDGAVALATSPAVVTTTSSGSIPSGVTATIPSSPQGSNSLTVTDGAYTLTQNFNVNSATLSINKTSGPISTTTVIVTGTGFAPSTPISSFTIGGSPETSGISNGGSTDSYGSFTNTFSIPTIPGGSQSVSASDGSNAGTTSFNVTPVTTLTSSLGAPGSSDSVTGNGFTANAPVTIKYGDTNVASVTAAGDGTFSSTSFTIPSSSTGGHSVTAVDTSSLSSASTLTINSATEALLPSSGPVGTSVKVTGSGYAGLSTMSFTYDGSTIATTPANVTTRSTGTFTATVTIPASDAGTHTIEATDGSNISGSKTFTVTPTLALSSTSGLVGSSVTVKGNGFAGTGSITTFTFDGIDETSSLTSGSLVLNANGTFTATFTIPSDTAGAKTISASDGTNSATSTYTIGSTPLSTSPSSGKVGTVASLSGSGFANNSIVTLKFDGSNIGIAHASGTGVITSSITIPAGVLGSHAILATDGTTSLTTGFTILPYITATPTTGTIGTVVSVSGTGYSVSPVTISYNRVSTGVTVTPNTVGSFSTTFTLAANPGGLHLILANDTSNNVNSTAFTVSPQITSLTPTSGKFGDTITVTGNGFSATPSSITINLNHTAVITGLSALSNGNIPTSTTFTVPQASHGLQSVTGTDDITTTPSVTFTDAVPVTSTSPTTGPHSTVITLTGNGFANHSAMTIKFGSTAESSVNTNGTGSFVTTFNVPIAAAAGSVTITSKDASLNSASSSFTVANPTLTLSPSTGSNGTTVTVTGSNYIPSGNLAIRFNGHTLFNVTATGAGAIPSATTFTVPSSAAASKTVTVFDGTNTGTATLNVVAPSLTISPTTGPPGTVVTLKGINYIQSQSVALRFNGITQGVNATTNSTGGLGNAGVTLVVPASGAGSKQISVFDGLAKGTASFTVVLPTLSTSVSTGHFGTNVTLSGTSFNASRIITFTFDGNPITTSPSTVTSLPSGAIPAHVTFLVPSAAKGSTHSIQAMDGTNTVSAPAFTVTPFISLSPTTGPKGTPVTVTGDGFAGTGTATLAFNNAHGINSTALIT